MLHNCCYLGRYYKWLVHGRAYPAPLWDSHALVPKAPFLWGSGEQLCSVLNATDDIALVGNGPITPEQRAAISQHGRVVRFNALNNRRAWLLISFFLDSWGMHAR
jgi:hypothetical protein